MVMKYSNKLIPGDQIIFQDGDIQIVKNISVGYKEVMIKLNSGKSVYVSHTTKFPVIKSNFDPDKYTIEQMYNMVLDDEISLSDFTLWCQNV